MAQKALRGETMLRVVENNQANKYKAIGFLSIDRNPFSVAFPPA